VETLSFFMMKATCSQCAGVATQEKRSEKITILGARNEKNNL